MSRVESFDNPTYPDEESKQRALESAIQTEMEFLEFAEVNIFYLMWEEFANQLPIFYRSRLSMNLKFFIFLFFYFFIFFSCFALLWRASF